MYARGQLSCHSDLRARRAAGRRHDDPRPDDRDADLEPVALARAAGRRRDDEGRGERPGDEKRLDRAPHGTLLNRNADSEPPTRSSSAAPPAKKSVTSRSSSRSPRREPSSS